LKNNHEKLLIYEKLVSIGRLTAGIAHEMNTPLAAIRSNLYELTNLIDEQIKSLGDPDINQEDFKEILGEMINSVNMADKSVEKSMGFIKNIKSKTMNMGIKEKMNFNVVEIIEKSILMVNHILVKNKISVDIIRVKGEYFLYGNPENFTRIIDNLLTNSIDAMIDKPDGHIKIELSENENYLIISIEDEGCGIPESNLTKIYDPLFTTKPFGQSSGMGLTIVHDIIYWEFEGEILVNSEVGSGTTFILKFKK
jgi:signal transduction histidine kinase